MAPGRRRELALGLAAVVAGMLLLRPLGWPAGLLALTGAALLALRAQEAAHHPRDRALDVAATCVFLGAMAFALLPTDVPFRPRAAVAVVGAMALLWSLVREPTPDRKRVSRSIAKGLGHGLLAMAAIFMSTRQGPLDISLLPLAGGAGTLLLLALWTQRTQPVDPGPGPGWQTVMLLCLSSAAAIAVAAQFRPAARGWTHIGVALCLLLAFAVLARPGPAPSALRGREGTLAQALTHALAGLVLINTLVLVLRLLSPWAVRAVFALYLLWLLIASATEYAAVWHARKVLRRFRDPAPDVDVPSITVLVSVANEGEVARDALRSNLAAHPQLTFLVVAARKFASTFEMMTAIAAEQPDRVRVVAGETGSKAGDLNAAWPLLRTDLVLMLDADEVMDQDLLRWAVARMQAEPDVGVVQGRKVSRAPDAGRLARFVSAERRFSTLLDSPLQSDVFGTAHFAGSSALLRREVPPSVGGWRHEMLTEDIDFSLRLALSTSWRIVYEPRMATYESDPTSVKQHVRPRTRWARGWTEVAMDHLPSLWRSIDRLGARRVLGWTFVLLTSISAPWSILAPALVILFGLGLLIGPPLPIAILLAAVLLPSRFVTFAYASLRDPHAPLRRTPRAIAGLAGHAYLWIAFGWLVQLHALYMELSAGAAVWYITEKRAHRAV